MCIRDSVYTDSGRENLVTDENEVLSSGYGIDADSEAKQGLDALEKIIGIDDDEEEEDPEPECCLLYTSRCV